MAAAEVDRVRAGILRAHRAVLVKVAKAAILAATMMMIPTQAEEEVNTTQIMTRTVTPEVIMVT